MSEWQPINTAPRDGTKVLLAVVLTHPKQIGQEKDFYSISAWHGEFWHPFIPTTWTHWMPLPEPPVGEPTK